MGTRVEESRRASLALAVIVTGVLMTAVDTTIVVLALPDIERSLHVPLSGVIWVVIGYLLVITLLATQVGRLGDMFGRVRMYEAGFLVFVVGSALCALATSELTIIVYRVIQGVGGALITANSGAVIADTFPPERRGRAYGFNGVGYNLGAILGILLGGVIITYVDWRWIFWINVPTGLLAFVLAVRVLRDTSSSRRPRFDLAGMVLMGGGLFGVLWAMTQLATSSFSGTILTALCGGIALLVALVLLERRRAAPMLDLSLFRIPTVTPTLLASLFQGLASFAVLFLVIMYLQGVRDLTPLHASLLLVPGYCIGGIAGPAGGRLADRFGPVWPATVGLAVQAVSLVVYAQLGVTTPLWVVVVASTVNGIGATAFFPANTSAVMRAVPDAQFGVAAGLLRTFANIGMVFSFTVAILVAARSIPRGLAFAIFAGTTHLSHHLGATFAAGLHAAFFASIAFMALAAVLSATRVLAHRRARTAATLAGAGIGVETGAGAQGPVGPAVNGMPVGELPPSGPAASGPADGGPAASGPAASGPAASGGPAANGGPAAPSPAEEPAGG